MELMTPDSQFLSQLPKVSIVTPSFNQGKFIERTLLSVIGQNYPNLEYIVVDGASTDSTESILRKYAAHIDALIIEPDRGQADALNKGFRRCTGDLLAYINSDDCYAANDVISRAVNYFQAHPQVDVVYGQRDIINEAGYFVYANPYRPFCAATLKITDYLPQECAFWRRDIFERAGNQIQDNLKFALDYDLWYRFLEQGAEFLSVDEVFGLFRFYQNQKTTEQWWGTGLPEIEQVQRQYCDRPYLECEMDYASQQYYFGADPEREREVYLMARNLWNAFIEYKTTVLGTHPIDQWGYVEYTRKFPDAKSRYTTPWDEAIARLGEG